MRIVWSRDQWLDKMGSSTVGSAIHLWGWSVINLEKKHSVAFSKSYCSSCLESCSPGQIAKCVVRFRERRHHSNLQYMFHKGSQGEGWVWVQQILFKQSNIASFFSAHYSFAGLSGAACKSWVILKANQEQGKVLYQLQKIWFNSFLLIRHTVDENWEKRLRKEDKMNLF